MTRILLATSSEHKLAEIRAIIGGARIELLGLSDFPSIHEPEETGVTFGQNARLKATYYARELGMLALADDSGLCVDALDGAPGVISARYAGVPRSDDRNTDKLLDALSGVSDAQRAARFCCALALADPSGNILLEATGELHGEIARQRKGANGFGYDPVFCLPDGRHLAELDANKKNAISHRANALLSLSTQLHSMVG